MHQTTARGNARLEIGPQRGRNSHQIGVLGIYDLQSYGRTELLVADIVWRCAAMSVTEPGRAQLIRAEVLRSVFLNAVSPFNAREEMLLARAACCAPRCVAGRERAG